MALFDTIPNELLRPIAEAIVADLRHQDFADLLAFAHTCERFHSAAMPILYASAALRHPYLVAWAAETGNLAVLTGLLDAGMDPNTQFNFLVESYTGIVFFPGHVPPTDDPLELLWDHWMVPDEDILKSSLYQQGGYTSLFQFCSQAQAKARCEVRQYSAWRPNGPKPLNKWNHPIIRSPVFPLHFAAANGHVDAIRLLIRAGAVPDVPSSPLWGFLFRLDLTAEPHAMALGIGHEATPLRVALYTGQDEAFWELRSHGAALLDYGSRCDAVLQYAVELGRRDIVARLMHGVTTAAEANRKDPLLGRSLLWTACQVDNIPVVRQLAALGADLNEDFGTGYTPLFDAVLFRRVEMAKELLALGAARDIVFRGPCGAKLHSFEEAGLDLRGFSPVDVCAWLMQPPDEKTLDAAKYWDNPIGSEPVTLEELRAVGRELAEAFREAGADVEASVGRVAAWHEAQSETGEHEG